MRAENPLNGTNTRALLITALQIGSSVTAHDLANGLRLDIHSVLSELNKLEAEGVIRRQIESEQPYRYSLINSRLNGR